MIDMNELQPGCEQMQNFKDHRGKDRIQYDYRDFDGQVFSCIAGNQEECVARKDAWLSAK